MKNKYSVGDIFVYADQSKCIEQKYWGKLIGYIEEVTQPRGKGTQYFYKLRYFEGNHYFWRRALWFNDQIRYGYIKHIPVVK